MANVVSLLLHSHLQPSSIPTYQRAWNLFCQFYYDTFPASSLSLPLTPSILALFIAYLFRFGYAPSTAQTYVSALGYFHKLRGFPDPSKMFFISSMLKGYGKLGFRQDSRLPITLPMLHKILESSTLVLPSHYIVLQFKAMCNFAFHAFLRIGEITWSHGKHAPRPLYLNQIKMLQDSQGIIRALKIIFLNYKHNYNNSPFALEIPWKQTHCPMQGLLDYLQIRGDCSGPLFINADGSPVLRSQFQANLNLVLTFCHFDLQVYKGHSFRIGAATLAAQQGCSDAQIRIMGRWKSDAFKKYLRVESLVAS